MTRLPVVFIGHGSPMNAIQTNDFTKALAKVGAELPRPQSILCISAHWVTQQTFVGCSATPRQIYDFGGFPDELFQVIYRASGSPDLAERVRELLPPTSCNNEWGIDHGTWAVLKHIFPDADIPVVQLSLNAKLNDKEHYDLGRSLRPLRDEAVLILASGNIVHNLYKADLRRADGEPYPEAVDFDAWVAKRLDDRDFETLANFREHRAASWAHPTVEHYWPLLYAAGAADDRDDVKYVYEGIENRSISMRGFVATAPESKT